MGRDIWAERVYPVSRNLLADALGEHVGALPVHRDHAEHLEVALAHEDVVGGVLDDRAMEHLPEVLHRVRDRRRTAEGQAVVVVRQLSLGRREFVHFDLDALALGVLARRDAGEVEGVRARREEQLRSGAHTVEVRTRRGGCEVAAGNSVLVAASQARARERVGEACRRTEDQMGACAPTLHPPNPRPMGSGGQRAAAGSSVPVSATTSRAPYKMRVSKIPK